VLVCWACSLYIILLVNQLALWYIALFIDFGVYMLLYGSEEEKKEDEEGDEEEEEQEGENEEMDGEGEEGEAEFSGGSFVEQPSDAIKSQPATSRASARRTSDMLTKLQM